MKKRIVYWVQDGRKPIAVFRAKARANSYAEFLKLRWDEYPNDPDKPKRDKADIKVVKCQLIPMDDQDEFPKDQ